MHRKYETTCIKTQKFNGLHSKVMCCTCDAQHDEPTDGQTNSHVRNARSHSIKALPINAKSKIGENGMNGENRAREKKKKKMSCARRDDDDRPKIKEKFPTSAHVMYTKMLCVPVSNMCG